MTENVIPYPEAAAARERCVADSAEAQALMKANRRLGRLPTPPNLNVHSRFTGPDITTGWQLHKCTIVDGGYYFCRGF
jgi:hypothetical protein